MDEEKMEINEENKNLVFIVMEEEDFEKEYILDPG